tara:strand:- start:95 stop:424 length:330 start_codon:yes stop_codon:yes gene_type:complete
MYKKFKALGQLGKYLYKQGKEYYKSGGKKQKDIVKESGVSRATAKADIKSEIKRKAFRNKKPSDFIPRIGGKGFGGVKDKFSAKKLKQSKYQSDLRRFNEGYGRDPRKK